jgi:hypothetical protein
MRRRLFAVPIAFLALLGFDHGWCSTDPARYTPSPGLFDTRHPSLIRDQWGRSRDRSALSRTAQRSSVPGDELWWDGFGLPITDGRVNTAINYNGSLVIAGSFTRIGDVHVDNIARWSETGWVPLGIGIIGTVNCLAIYQGDLVAGGGFWDPDVGQESVLRWDGSSWSNLGEGLREVNTTVVSLASHGDTLVAARDAWHEYHYPIPPGSQKEPAWPYLVNLWNGSEWVDLQGANGGITSLAFFDGGLFAGGAFDSLGGLPAGNIGRWDGDSWSEVGGGLSSSSFVAAMCVHSGELVLGGTIDLVGSVGQENVVTWNGAQWGALGGLPAVSTLLSTGQALFAGGSGIVAHWNGLSWELSPPLEGVPSSIADVGDYIVVAGPVAFADEGNTATVALSVARLSDGVWAPLMPVGDGMRGLTHPEGNVWVESLAAHRGHIIAAGHFQFAGAPPGWAKVDGMAEWTGTGWAPFPRPQGLDYVYLLLSEEDTLYAAGWSIVYPPVAPAIWHYDGTAWTGLGAPAGLVNAMTTYRGSLVAAFGDPDAGLSVRLWTGSEWEDIGHGEDFYYPLIQSMVEWDGKLVVAGRFTSINGVPLSNIAAWNGSVWEPIGPGLPSPPNRPGAALRSLGVADGRLAVSGDAINGVAYWSGVAWEPLGQLNDPAYLLESGPHLFATGYRYNNDLSLSHWVARWQQDSWVELGSGTNSWVACVAALGNSVYMGGGFSEAGGKASYAVARWDITAPHVTPTLEAARPNPFATTTAFTYVLTAPGAVRLAVHDVTGREIAVIDEGTRSPGPHTVTWHGQDRSGDKAPSGVYFISATLPGGVHKARKVVLLR